MAENMRGVSDSKWSFNEKTMIEEKRFEDVYGWYYLYKPVIEGELKVSAYYNKSLYINGKIGGYLLEKVMDHERRHIGFDKSAWNTYSTIVNQYERFYCGKDCARIMYNILYWVMNYARELASYQNSGFDYGENKVKKHAINANSIVMKVGVLIDGYNKAKCQTASELFADSGICVINDFKKLDIKDFSLYSL